MSIVNWTEHKKHTLPFNLATQYKTRQRRVRGLLMRVKARRRVRRVLMMGEARKVRINDG